MIQGETEGGKKRYAITEAGRQSLTEQAIALDGVRMRIDVSKRCCAAMTGRKKSTRPCTTCATPCKCTTAAGTRKKSCALSTCSTPPPKPSSTAP